jgi:GNAT superfamily N-acetyltransferase
MDIQYRHIKRGEESAVAALVEAVFMAHVAPLYTPEGVEEFLGYAEVSEFTRRLQREHVILVAETDAQIVGMIELREQRHISLLFVADAYQGRGIASEMLARAIQLCRRVNPDLRALTVHASPNAAPIYRRLGFVPSAEEQVVHGIRYTPMTLVLASDASVSGLRS